MIREERKTKEQTADSRQKERCQCPEREEGNKSQDAEKMQEKHQDTNRNGEKQNIKEKGFCYQFRTRPLEGKGEEKKKKMIEPC